MKLDLFLFFLLLLYFDCSINESLDWFVLPNLYGQCVCYSCYIWCNVNGLLMQFFFLLV